MYGLQQRTTLGANVMQIPASTERVAAHTSPEINAQIRLRTEDTIARLRNGPPDAIAARLRELDHEWDIERAIEANAATLSLVGLALPLAHDKRWIWLPTTVAGFLLQHALQGWCPPIPVLRRLGFRTAYEIDYERCALQPEAAGTVNGGSIARTS